MHPVRSFLPCSARRRPAVESHKAVWIMMDGVASFRANPPEAQAPFAHKANRPIECNPAHACEGRNYRRPPRPSERPSSGCRQ
jgi:hypothetical protein